MPCALDPASELIFEELGFVCIGTTGGGVNWAQGRQDYVYSVPREQMLEQHAAIVAGTSLPVSGDLENGYSTSPQEVAKTIADSIALGMGGRRLTACTGHQRYRQLATTGTRCRWPDQLRHGRVEQPLSIEMLTAVRNAAAAILATGNFDYLNAVITDPDINAYFKLHGR